MLRGDLGLREKPPEWLNEMIPYGNRYYSAFPLGAVISMVPVAILQKASLIHDFPARILGALIYQSESANPTLGTKKLVGTASLDFLAPETRSTSTTIISVVAVIVVLLAFLVAWVLVRRRRPG